jgi:capsular polysaccharide transport system permease protein
MAAFAAAVALPTLLGAAYVFGVAADLYVSEAQFWVRGQRAPQASILGGLLGGTALSASPEEALSVQNYIHSHDAVMELDARVGLREIYTRPEADWLRRLRKDASLERLVKFHRNMVEVRHDDRSGITTLRIHAFRPDDAQRAAEALLNMSEELVNRFSARTIGDSLRVARAEVQLAEARAAEARQHLGRFRSMSRELDPSLAGASVHGIITALEGQLAQLRAEIGEKQLFARDNNPLLATLRTRATSLENEIARSRARLTGNNGAISDMLGDYERLLLQREFADRGLTSALTSLEQSRVEALRQQLYLVRVVQPQLPQEPLFPRRWLLLAGIACGAIVAYGVGTLGVAAVRDHIT